jgi:alanyl-tRNA synthetase
MSTEKFYYDFFSSDIFNTRIAEIRPLGDKAVVILDKTIFYPEGGGQSGDRGTINGVPLLDVQEKNGEILHLVSGADSGRLTPGDAALRLDLKRRRDLTVSHSAQHLLSGIILKLTGKYTVSMHLGDEVCTVDVDAQDIAEETLLAVEEAVADAIEENHPLHIHLCPPEKLESFPLRKVPPQGEEVIRVVEIEGCDFSPCCGTHIKASGEIGILRILGAEKYKGMTRLTFIAGRRCLNDSRALRKNADSISRALKIPVTEIGKGVLDYMDKAAAIEKRLKQMEENAAQLKAEALVKKAGLPPAAGADSTAAASNASAIFEAYTDSDSDEILRIGRAAQKITDKILVLASEKDLKFACFCGAKGVDVRPLVKAAFEAAGGKGGGGPSFFQGSFASSEALAGFISSFS